jgi:DcmR-like sensory protein
MNATGAAVLANPHPCGHIVYPYTDENLVSQAVCLYASAGLRNGEGVILIMAAAHCNSINGRIAAEGFDVEALKATGRLTCIVAEDLLSGFLVDGMPDENLFKTIVDRIIRKARASTGKGDLGQVRIFGEMVNLLLNTNLAACTRLEELWSQAIDNHSVSVMCTYALCGSAHETLPESLTALHSHSLA